MPASRNSAALPSSDRTPALVFTLAILAGAGGALYFYTLGSLLYYGDAQAHLNIARRLWDSRTPGWNQIGTVWLPLPHLLVSPFTRNDWLWRTGLAGAIPSVACFVAACLFLFGAARRAFSSQAAGLTAAVLFALNPNLLYLQSAAMTEAVFFAALAALLYFSLRFRQSPSAGNAACAGLAALAGTLTRYEGWFVLPFAAGYILLSGGRRRVLLTAVFSVIAGLGPLFWLAHNWWYFGDALEFFRGPYSPAAIQGAKDYPGYRNWGNAWLYYRSAAVLCTQTPILWLAAAGAVASLFKRVLWPLILLTLPPLFYVVSMYSSGGTPIYVPHLWPHSYYNTRYGLAILPLAAFAAAALAASVPKRVERWAALAAIALAVGPWLGRLQPENWVTWKESQVNSEARRAWTRQASQYLSGQYRPGSGILTSFGDVTGIFARAGIPLRDTLTGDNMPHWEAAVVRPDLFLWEEWALAVGNDRVEAALARPSSPKFERRLTIAIKGAPPIAIYQKAASRDANTIYQSAR